MRESGGEGDRREKNPPIKEMYFKKLNTYLVETLQRDRVRTPN